ncbi:hypothetical protein HYPSUDRAFT_38892 [Hypholoma sublateritium FD-334 SS-4]|uniref:Uncharacterized protein n=1 Tax=Hypholoma sublateritium (strain FD-334 SS-4) TaxID=945553 RepID=A0A0D2LB19_HYPSF|nr:hypothetical protein HYPSUDRAFT_38892 [Hypholoma sublateritium FD-334 SS-4]
MLPIPNISALKVRHSAFTAPANNDPSAAHLPIVSPQYFFPIHPAPLIVRRLYRRLQCASLSPHVLTGSLSFWCVCESAISRPHIRAWSATPGCCVTIAAPSPLKTSSLGRRAHHHRQAT